MLPINHPMPSHLVAIAQFYTDNDPALSCGCCGGADVWWVQFCEVMRRSKNLSNKDVNKLRVTVFGATGAVFGVIAMILLPTGYFGPLSARVRGLFVRHTRTGNPLVDSVAEHQPASPQVRKEKWPRRG